MTEERDDWEPTSAGGTTGAHVREPGQSLGQVPDPDDDDRDEAGDPNAGRPRRDPASLGWRDPDDQEQADDRPAAPQAR